MSAPGGQASEVANVTVVTATNRSRTISVRATDQGLPVEVKIDKSELRYGAQALADEVMRLTREAALEAGARRREHLARVGVSNDVLNRLGLPTRAELTKAQPVWEEDEDVAPMSWKRPV